MRKMVLAAVVLSMLLLSGCHKEALHIGDLEKSTLLIRDNKSIQAGFVENFSKKYYNEDELESFVKEQIKEYNEENDTDIDLDGFKVKGKKAYLLMSFPDMETYADFIQVENVVERFDDALDSMELPEKFSSMKEEGEKAADEIKNPKNYTIAIIKEDIDVTVEGEIAYYTGGAILNNRKIEAQADGDKYTVLLFK